MALFGKRRADSTGTTTLFFASDLHGSEICFKKFVNAARFYHADLLILGGDVSGKLVVPLVKEGNGSYRTHAHGRDQIVTPDAVDDFEAGLHNSGVYTRRMSPDEYRYYQEEPDAAENLVVEAACDTLARWIEYAKERLEGTNVRIVTAPGNDDPWAIDDIIRDHGGDRFQLVEGQIIDICPRHQMLNTGYTNVTPWNTQREYPEETIAAHIDAMATQLSDTATAIFNIHVPPYNSRIDTAPLLDDELRVQTSMGSQRTAPVGSTAVREALERYQPLVSLHGHIHESGGVIRIGRTVAINVGSEYGEGVLRGVLVRVGGGQLIGYQATSG